MTFSEKHEPSGKQIRSAFFEYEINPNQKEDGERVEESPKNSASKAGGRGVFKKSKWERERWWEKGCRKGMANVWKHLWRRPRIELPANKWAKKTRRRQKFIRVVVTNTRRNRFSIGFDCSPSPTNPKWAINSSIRPAYRIKARSNCILWFTLTCRFDH